MFPDTEFSAGSGAVDRTRRRLPLGTAGLALALAVLIATVLTGAAPASANLQAHFVPEASSATWDGSTVAVTFTEVGVEPGATTTVAMTATGNVQAVCRQGSMVFVNVRASSTVMETSDFLANADGTVTGNQLLNVSVNLPIVKGLGCTTEITRTFTVTLQDLDTGAILVITGQPVTTRVPA